MTTYKWENGQAVPETAEEAAELAALRAALRPEPTFADRQATKIEAIRALTEAKLAAGAPIVHEGETLHVSVSDGSRADIGGMATNATATIVTSGVVSWQEAYILGWITLENIRKPLLDPMAGLQFGSTVVSYYADTRQHGRTLKDAVLAAEDDVELDAIDIEGGWPG